MAQQQQIPEREVSVIQQGSALVFVISKKAMRDMEKGNSIAVEMVKGDKKLSFMLIEKETYSKIARKFAEKMLRERSEELKDLGESLNEEMGARPIKKRD